jgi:hypothetical protein
MTDQHPIPLECIDKIDVLSFHNDGSVIMTIITTGYLDDSTDTKDRLFRKVNNYLSMFNSEDFEEQHGQISYDQLTITLVYKQEPHPSIVELVDQLSAQLSEHGIKMLMDAC